MKDKCCICGRGVGMWSTYRIYYHDTKYIICTYCNDAIAKTKSKKQSIVEDGTLYLRTQLEIEGKCDPEAIPMIKHLLHEDEPKESSRSSDAAARDEPLISSSVPLVAGIIFLVLSGILYFVSINNNYGVANIQATMYSGASFVAAIVCFAATRIIDAVNSR